MTFYAITNARIIPVDQPIIERGTIVWQDETIVAVGSQAQWPEGTEVMDGTGLWLTPGLIDAHTHVGIMEEIYEEGNDLNEVAESAVTPSMRAIDGINPYDPAFKDALSGGVTTVMIAPGSANVIGGSVSILKTAGEDFEAMILDPEAGVKTAFGENPKRVYGELKKLPSTRMGIASLLRQTLVEAQDYAAQKAKNEAESAVTERDLGLELLVRLLKGEIPMRAHAHRADDMLTAIRLAKEFNLPLIIEHATEGSKLIPLLLKENIPVVVGPGFANRAKVEMQAISWANAVAMAQAGVCVALITDHSCTPIQYLSLCAAMTVRFGLSWEEAIKTITLNPAKIMKLDHRLGSLTPGKDADIAVFDGDPFHYATRTHSTYVNGKRVWHQGEGAHLG